MGSQRNAVAPPLSVLILCYFFGIACAKESVYAQQKQLVRRWTSEGQDSPSNDGKNYKRGDIDGCSFSESDEEEGRPLPCRDAGFPGGPDIPPNLLTADVYVGIPPKRKTVAPTLTAIVSMNWDRSLDNMNFIVGNSYSKFYSSDSRDGPGQNRKGGGGNGGGGQGGNGVFNKKAEQKEDPPPTSNRHLVVGENGIRYLVKKRLQPNRELQRARIFDMHHTQTVSELVTKNTLRWWWRISITYECFWEEDGGEVGQAVMTEIAQNMTTELDIIQDTVVEQLQQHHRDGAIRFRTEQEGIPESTVDDADIENQLSQPSSSPPPAAGFDEDFEEREPLDAQEWDWRNYLGLSMLGFTLVSTVILVCLGARRQRRKEQSKNWGNLTTEEGVEKLLNTGWALEGSNMQIYDKTKVGYLEDDSIFLGGYEQREAVVGAEITITQPESETTRDLGGMGTVADTQSHNPSALSHREEA